MTLVDAQSQSHKFSEIKIRFDSSIWIPRDCKLGIGYGSENKTRSEISF